jgi:hypothetical protein
MHGSAPHGLDSILLALASASPPDIERGAAAFDGVQRSLRTVAGRLERALGDLDEAWQGLAALSPAVEEPLRRTRAVLVQLDNEQLGKNLRTTASVLDAGQARVRDLSAQRASGVTDVPLDRTAQHILRDIAHGYHDVGSAMGGQSPPSPVPVDEPVVLAGAADPAQLFRPTDPVPSAKPPGEPVLPPSPGGSGMGMMPFMPAMGGGMGGGMPEPAAPKRKGADADPGLWGAGQDSGWTVIGRAARATADGEERAERVNADRQEFRAEFERQIRRAMRGDNRDG